MKIWLLENGERTGPHESFLIRERVDRGELDGGTQAWFKGARDWMRLDEVPMLTGLFDEDGGSLVVGEEVQESAEKAVEKEREVQKDLVEVLNMMGPPKLYMVRRFFARLFDMALYLSLVLALFQSVEVIPKLGLDLKVNLMIGFGYVLLDAGMTHAWRSSPGKWILGVRVTDAFGHAIGLGGSLMRSLRVWVLGWGMWLIPEMGLLVSWFMARRLKYFIWDLPRRYRVVCQPFVWQRAMVMMGGYLMMGAFLETTLSAEFVERIRERVEELKTGL